MQLQVYIIPIPHTCVQPGRMIMILLSHWDLSSGSFQISVTRQISDQNQA